MIIDVDFNGSEQTTMVTFAIEQFKGDRDYHVASSIVQTFSADFDLDPELEKEDFVDIIEKAHSGEGNHFTFYISEEGIEVDIQGEEAE